MNPTYLDVVRVGLEHDVRAAVHKVVDITMRTYPDMSLEDALLFSDVCIAALQSTLDSVKEYRQRNGGTAQ